MHRIVASETNCEEDDVLLAVDAAKYILTKSGGMTMIQLHGIVYYSQLWSLVWCKKSLFEEDVKGWANGCIACDLDEYSLDGFKVNEDNFWDGDIDAVKDVQKDCMDSVMNALDEEKSRWLKEILLFPYKNQDDDMNQVKESSYIDFRDRIINAVKEGGSIRRVSQNFDVSENLTKKLVAQMLVTGYVTPRIRQSATSNMKG
jgi:uncharacterized phage-associated protein